MSGTLQSVRHLLLNAAPLTEHSAVVGMHLVQTEQFVTQPLHNHTHTQTQTHMHTHTHTHTDTRTQTHAHAQSCIHKLAFTADVLMSQLSSSYCPVVTAMDLHPATWVQLLLLPLQSLVAAGRTSGQTCSSAPVKVLPTLLGTSQSMNKGINDVKSGCQCHSSPPMQS